jgi:hypothetical protein
MLASHLFVSSCDGALHDTRQQDWTSHPIRAIYSRTFSRINSTLELRATLRAGAYAWPGGYPMFFITSDGEALSFESVRAEYAQCARSTRDKARDGWQIVACDVNWENAELTCAHSGRMIESAYGETE